MGRRLEKAQSAIRSSSSVMNITQMKKSSGIFPGSFKSTGKTELLPGRRNADVASQALALRAPGKVYCRRSHGYRDRACLWIADRPGRDQGEGVYHAGQRCGACASRRARCFLKRVAQDIADDGHAASDQRQYLYRGSTHYLRISHARELRSAIRCDGDCQTARTEVFVAREDKSRRICDGLINRKFRRWTQPQSLESAVCAGWIQRRICSGCRSRRMCCGLGLRYWRVDPSACGILWGGGPQADLWASLSVWVDRLCLLT